MIAFNTNLGLTQGVLPLIAYNYGARKHDRMREVIRFTVTVSLGFSVCCTILFRVFSRQLVMFFID